MRCTALEIRRQDRRGPLVAAHDQLEEIVGGRARQLAHAQVVDDEQRDGREIGQDDLRVPSSVASAMSSISVCASR